jgi:hypothetical protein
MKYIHHHLGLGDHIVCNAIVLSLFKKYTDITLAVKEHGNSKQEYPKHSPIVYGSFIGERITAKDTPGRLY